MQTSVDQIRNQSSNSLLGIPGVTAPLVLRIGVTGHKQLDEHFFVQRSDDLAKSVMWMVEAVMQYLDEAMAHTPRKYQIVSPLAEGGDILLTEAILQHLANPELSLCGPPELQIVVPMPLAEYREEFVDANQKRILDELIFRSINPDETPLVTEANTREQRHSAYEAVTKTVAERCDILVALWDGRSTKSDAGTAATVRETRRLGKPVVHLRPKVVNVGFPGVILPKVHQWVANSRLALWLFPFCGIRILDDDDSVLTSLRHLDSFNIELRKRAWRETGSVLNLADTDATLTQVRDAYESLTEPLNSDPLTKTYFDNNYGRVLSQVLLPVRRGFPD